MFRQIFLLNLEMAMKWLCVCVCAHMCVNLSGERAKTEHCVGSVQCCRSSISSAMSWSSHTWTSLQRMPTSDERRVVMLMSKDHHVCVSMTLHGVTD